MAKAFIYWNSHKHCFSIKYRGRVIAHANRFVARNAEFKIYEKGRQRALTEGRKNVHAGILCNPDDLFCDSDGCSVKGVRRFSWPDGTAAHASLIKAWGEQVRYNPYETSTFIVSATGRPVTRSVAVYGCRNLLHNRATLWAERIT